MPLQKRVQSRAYAPPQGPPTRSPPITRDATIPLAAAHTLAAFFSSPAASHAPLRPGPRGRAPVCTGSLSLTTPNGAPHRPRSRICALPFTGGGAGACLRIGIHFYIYLHHTWSRTQTPRTPGALYGCLHGPVAQFRSKRLCSVQHAPLTRDQRQCGRAADCPAHWLATIKSRRRRASQLRLPLQRRPHGSLKKAAISR